MFTKQLICAGRQQNTRTQQSRWRGCYEDEGSPLQFFDSKKNQYYQVGIYLDHLAEFDDYSYNGIFTKTTDYYIFTFIQDILKGRQPRELAQSKELKEYKIVPN